MKLVPTAGVRPRGQVHTPSPKGAEDKRIAFVALSFLVLVPGGYAAAQVAGSTRLGVAVEEMKTVALGRSAKRQVLGQSVYDE